MGIVSIKTISPVSKLGVWHMSEPWQQLQQMLHLPAPELEVLGGVSKEKRKQEWLACRALLQEMLGRYGNIGYNADRKPYIQGVSKHISMSHSGAYACVYLHDHQSVGIDIQQMKPSISKGAFYFLNNAEMQWADLEDNVQMHLIWSAKESVFKYAGDGALDLKKHIIVSPFARNQNRSFEVNLQKGDNLQLLQLQFDTFEDYVLTWTV